MSQYKITVEFDKKVIPIGSSEKDKDFQYAVLVLVLSEFVGIDAKKLSEAIIKLKK